MESESSTPTKEAMKASQAISYWDSEATDTDIEETAAIIDRELKYPALLESHKQLQGLLREVVPKLCWMNNVGSRCDELIGEIEKELAKAKDITP